jgi:demethylmenaquinone methyltransferase/2-methoxy-6-polyprenyl-1,4-benzoquinol methylase
MNTSETPANVKPYNPEEGKKAQVERMFDRIAPRYDLLNRLLSLRMDVAWRRDAIRQLAAKKPKTVLDAATGTADVAIMAAKALPEAHITGIDISNQMLALGRDKIRQLGLEDRIHLQTGDGEALPYPDHHFDAVTVAFGVRNFEHLERGLAELHRVLRPGGQIIVLEFSRPTLFPFKQLYNAYFKYVLPAIGRLTSKDPRAYQYLFESVQAFPDGERFTSILSQTGFKDTACNTLTLGVCSLYTAVKSS